MGEQEPLQGEFLQMMQAHDLQNAGLQWSSLLVPILLSDLQCAGALFADLQRGSDSLFAGLPSRDLQIAGLPDCRSPFAALSVFAQGTPAIAAPALWPGPGALADHAASAPALLL